MNNVTSKKLQLVILRMVSIFKNRADVHLPIHEFRGGGGWDMGGGGLKVSLPPYENFVKGYPPHT